MSVTSDMGISIPEDLADRVRGLRCDPAAEAMAARWRTLSDGGGSTLVACSGGADSLALALCLASVDAPFTLGHVRHDMRAASVTESEAAFVEAIGGALGVEVDVRSIASPAGENAEGAARRLRYGALGEMCRERGIEFVATAHHGQDQIESMLMAMLRGAGPRGLGGVASKRRLDDGVMLIRPALAQSREDCEQICELAGIGWIEDETNRDTSRLRAALRHGAVAELMRLRPGASARAARSAAMLHDAAGLIADRAEGVFGDAREWPRDALRRERRVVLGTGFRRAALLLTDGAGADQFDSAAVDRIVDAVLDKKRSPRVIEWARGVRFEVRARSVRIELDERAGNGAS